jgi:hypothetical protein
VKNRWEIAGVVWSDCQEAVSLSGQLLFVKLKAFPASHSSVILWCYWSSQLSGADRNCFLKTRHCSLSFFGICCKKGRRCHENDDKTFAQLATIRMSRVVQGDKQPHWAVPAVEAREQNTGATTLGQAQGGTDKFEARQPKSPHGQRKFTNTISPGNEEKSMMDNKGNAENMEIEANLANETNRHYPDGKGHQDEEQAHTRKWDMFSGLHHEVMIKFSYRDYKEEANALVAKCQLLKPQAELVHTPFHRANCKIHGEIVTSTTMSSF